MRKLISMVCSALVFAGCLSMPRAYEKKIFYGIGIPERFIGYEKKQAGSIIFNRNGERIGIKDYEINDDGILDVREMYLLDENADVMNFGDAKPFLYLWNIDSDAEFEDNESLFDPNKDGINGNEKWFYQIISEGKTELTVEEMINRI